MCVAVGRVVKVEGCVGVERSGVEVDVLVSGGAGRWGWGWVVAGWWVGNARTTQHFLFVTPSLAVKVEGCVGCKGGGGVRCVWMCVAGVGMGVVCCEAGWVRGCGGGGVGGYVWRGWVVGWVVKVEVWCGWGGGGSGGVWHGWEVGVGMDREGWGVGNARRTQHFLSSLSRLL